MPTFLKSLEENIKLFSEVHRQEHFFPHYQLIMEVECPECGQNQHEEFDLDLYEEKDVILCENCKEYVVIDYEVSMKQIKD